MCASSPLYVYPAKSPFNLLDIQINHPIPSCRVTISEYSSFIFQLKCHILSSAFPIFLSIHWGIGCFYFGEKIVPLTSMIYVYVFCIIYCICILSFPIRLWGPCFGLFVSYLFLFLISNTVLGAAILGKFWFYFI